jgi:hypothetical protein
MALSAEWRHLFHDVILTAMWRYLPFLFNFKEVLYVQYLYLKTKKLLSVFPLFMTNMLSFLQTRFPTKMKS